MLTLLGVPKRLKVCIYDALVLEGCVMGSAIGLRDDFGLAALRRLSRSTKSAKQARRVLALAEIYDGGSRIAAARIGGVGLQIVRDWVVRFNARGPVACSTAKHRDNGRGSIILGGGRLSRQSSAARSRRSMASLAGV